MRGNHQITPESRRCLLFGLVATVATLGCANAFLPSLDSRSPEEKKDATYRRCSEEDTRTWDLGTGRLPEIRTKAPTFYDLNPTRIKSYTNERRIYLLSDVQLPKDLVLDQRYKAEPDTYLPQVLEFISLKTKPSKLVGFMVHKNGEQAGAMLLTGAACPHVIVEDKCIDDRLQVEVHVKDPLACVNGRSGEFSVRFGDGTPQKIEPNVPVFVEYDQLNTSVTLLVGGKDVVFQGPVNRVDPEKDLADATPATVLALIRAGSDMTAGKAYAQMKETLRTPEFDTQVTKLRIQTNNARAEATKSPRELIQLATVIEGNLELPGSDEVLEAIRPKLISAFNECAGIAANRQSFNDGIVLVRGLPPDSKDLDLETFKTKYGQALIDEKMGTSQKDQTALENLFVAQFPESTFSSKIIDRRTKRAEEAAKLAAKEQAEEEAEERKDHAEARTRCVSTCQHKCMAGRYWNKDLCLKGCINIECDENPCVGYCQADCSIGAKSEQPGCTQACIRGRCGQ